MHGEIGSNWTPTGIVKVPMLPVDSDMNMSKIALLEVNHRITNHWDMLVESRRTGEGGFEQV